MLSPRLMCREESQRSPRQSTNSTPGPARPPTLKNFGSLNGGRPVQPMSPSGSFRSPRGDFRSPRDDDQGSNRRRRPSKVDGAPIQPAPNPLVARLRERGGNITDGRDCYDIWYGLQQGETPSARPARASRPSEKASTASSTRDGFEMFYEIGDSAGRAAPMMAVPDPASTAMHAANAAPTVPTVPRGGAAAAEEWLREVKDLEGRLQAALAAGPKAKAKASSSIRVAPPVDQSMSKEKTSSKEVQVFSVSTPAAPAPSAPVSLAPPADCEVAEEVIQGPPVVVPPLCLNKIAHGT
eukprot:CAMPEP_0170616490 /NCGR_PEP_ID=MMETSP0224-20130122/25897_1 /TAXON_ID=285029 /ORGANISM="Togula jolla, Strain CCCM 725" /LENGTH=295 /DNA_ID=CAMNT_0010942289 /DNA_START=105 /DNA_END=992 /DNA_ORIENTATION=-